MGDNVKAKEKMDLVRCYDFLDQGLERVGKVNLKVFQGKNRMAITGAKSHCCLWTTVRRMTST